MKRVDMFVETGIHGPRRPGRAGYALEYITRKGVEVPMGEIIELTDSTEHESLLTVITVALERIHKGTEIVIHTDYAWAVNWINESMQEWERNGWRKKDGSPVKNAELLKQISERRKTDIITAEKGVGLKYGLWLKTEVKRNAKIHKAVAI